MSEPVVIILAAGGSVRMGKPKQLLRIKGQTLIRNTTELASAFSNQEVVVVLGNMAESIMEELEDSNVTIVFNENWQSGMAGSLKKGLSCLAEKNNPPEHVLILLCDQPLVSLPYLKKLYQLLLASGKKAVASAYNNTCGVPAIFEFQTLKQFTDENEDAGARYLLKKLDRKNQLATLAFPEGAIDLDTPEDYQDFLKEL